MRYITIVLDDDMPKQHYAMIAEALWGVAAPMATLTSGDLTKTGIALDRIAIDDGTIEILNEDLASAPKWGDVGWVAVGPQPAV